MVYALTLANSGRKDDAVTEGAKALELSPGDPVMLYNGGCLYAQLGDVARAIATLKQAITAGYWNVGWMQHDPDLNPLRGEPEFAELMQRR
jgi:Flp pilus assembly protein TadD